MTPPITPALLDWADVAAVAVLMRLAVPWFKCGLLLDVLSQIDEPLGPWRHYHAVISAALREVGEP